MTLSTEFTDSLAMEPEAPKDVKDGHSGNIYKGYFKAPATAKFRFYLACDDWCSMKFSTVDKDPTAAVQEYVSDGYTSYRNYLAGGSKTTRWFDLTKDSHYFMEV
jgi:hypothetical protein